MAGLIIYVSLLVSSIVTGGKKRALNSDKEENKLMMTSFYMYPIFLAFTHISSSLLPHFSFYTAFLYCSRSIK